VQHYSWPCISVHAYIQRTALAYGRSLNVTVPQLPSTNWADKMHHMAAQCHYCHHATRYFRDHKGPQLQPARGTMSYSFQAHNTTYSRNICCRCCCCHHCLSHHQEVKNHRMQPQSVGLTWPVLRSSLGARNTYISPTSSSWSTSQWDK
jgi:hypothetical protein